MFLFGKWKLITLKMMQLRKQYMDARVSESISVHRTLIYRTLPLLYKQMPEAENVFGPYRKFTTKKVWAGITTPPLIPSVLK